MNCLMVHSISSSTKNNAKVFSHNSVQGHYHSNFDIAYWADANQLRWSMTVGCLMDLHSPAAKYMSGVVHKRPILGCGVILGDEDNFLVISDMHLPYHHKDSFEFLRATSDYFGCSKILNVGDLFDHHSGSYHESEPDAYSPEQEYIIAKREAGILQEIFPEMIITQGNHDKIPQRKLKSAGLPSSMLQDYNEMYGLDAGWVWRDEYRFNIGKGKPILVPMELNKRSRWDGEIRA